MKSIRYPIAVLFLLVQQMYAQPVPKFGAASEGVRLSIFCSNNIVAAGTKNVLQCQIKNTSTNFVYFPGSPERWLQVFMIDDSGVVINLTKDPANSPGGGPVQGLKPNETGYYVVMLPVNKETRGGSYKLKAEMDMYVSVHPPIGDDSGEKYFRPVSNLLAVRVSD